MKSFLLVSGLAFAAIAATASAQSTPSSGPERLTLISANPIGLLFEWYNGEIEHAVAPKVSIAVAGSRFDAWDDRYENVDGILRYYPAGRAINGFSVGTSGGYARVTSCDNCFNKFEESVFALGVRADYVWLLGKDKHFAAAAGIGAKRLFGVNEATAGVPIGRLSLGYAW